MAKQLSPSISVPPMHAHLALASDANWIAIVADAQRAAETLLFNLLLLLAGRLAPAPRQWSSCRRRRRPPAGRTLACGSTATQGRTAITRRPSSVRRGRVARGSPGCNAVWNEVVAAAQTR